MTTLQRLTADNPAPWRTTKHEGREFLEFVLDANGAVVFEMTTYTGDGDKINLTNEQILALVDLVNEESLI